MTSKRAPENPLPFPRPIPVSELLRMVAAGEVKLPLFQRGFIWSQEKIRKLLDSIYHGYPIGMLLFWETFEELPEEDLGEFELPSTPDMKPKNYVLDGQQRLVSLFGALTGYADGQNDKFPVYFDLRTSQFTYDGGPDFPHRMKMSPISDLASLLDVLNEIRRLPDGDVLVKTAQDLATRFLNYPVPVLIIRESDMSKIAPIFERINSTGTKLTLFDFLVAALWTPEFNFKQQVAVAREALEPKGFDEIDEETVIRTLSAIVLGSAKRDTLMKDLRERERAQLAEDMQITRAALERAVDFLSTDVKVMGDDLLPYERQLVLLAFIFSKITQPRAPQMRVLRRWFWRTSFSERYRRGGEGLFDDDLQIAAESLDNADLLERFGVPPDASALVGGDFRTASAFTKAFVACLAVRGPRNLRSGGLIDVQQALSPYNRRQFHHIFPRKFLKEQSGPGHQHENSLANICMLSAEDNRAIGAQAPSAYLAELRKSHGDEFEAILDSNYIPTTCWPFIEADDFDGFLSERTDFLHQEIAKLIYG